MYMLQYDPRFTGYEIERRRSAAGVDDAVAGRRRPSMQIIREALQREDVWRISHSRRT